eukprot:g13440.t1
MHLPKHLIHEKLLNDKHKTQFYSLLASSFEGTSQDLESLSILVEQQLSLWTPLCKRSETLSFLLHSASKQSVATLMRLLKESLATDSAFEKGPMGTTSPSANITRLDDVKKCQYLIFHVCKLASIQKNYSCVQQYDNKTFLKISENLKDYQNELIQSRVEWINNLVLKSILAEEWGHFKEPKDKFKRCSNGLSMYIVQMSRLVHELDDFPVYASVFQGVFECTFKRLASLYVEILSVVSRARILQYKVDVITLVLIGLHFSYSFGPLGIQGINVLLNGLLKTLALFVGPPDEAINYFRKSTSGAEMESITGHGFYNWEAFKNIFNVEIISISERFRNRDDIKTNKFIDPRFLVQTVFAQNMSMDRIYEINLDEIYVKSLQLSVAGDGNGRSDPSKADSMMILSFRHEVRDFEYPPLTDDDKVAKQKLETFLKTWGKNQTV